MQIRPPAQEEIHDIVEMLLKENWKQTAMDIVAEDGNWPILVSVINEKAVGFLQGSYSETYSTEWRSKGQEGHQAWVFHLLVDAAYRRKGLGSIMIRAFALEAKARGCVYLGLEINQNEPISARISFFETLGFNQVSQDEPSIVVCEISKILTVRDSHP